MRRLPKPPFAEAGERDMDRLAVRPPGRRAVRPRRRFFPAGCGVACLRAMNDDDLILIGEHYGLGRMASRPFGIQRADRRQGLHLIGQSGAGKSSLMLRMLVEDIERGEGVTFIDPHGLNAEKLLDWRCHVNRAGVPWAPSAASFRPEPRAQRRCASGRRRRADGGGWRSRDACWQEERRGCGQPRTPR
jgi:hypothetical protein